MTRSSFLRFTALALVAAFSVSCADSPTEPGTRTLVAPPLPGSAEGTNGGEWIPVPPTATLGGRQVKGIRWESSRNPVEQSVSATIGPAGGSIALPASDFVMHFPEGALAAPTEITITAKESPWVSYDMTPHGLVFAKPVYAMQAIVNTTSFRTPTAFFLFGAYLAPGKETVGADDKALADETTASFIYLDADGVPTWSVWVLNHFSRYMLASG